MTVVINPGSGAIRQSGEGWTNTYEGAEQVARSYLAKMEAEGIRDVVLLLPGRPVPGVGRWLFQFQHVLTKVIVELDTHGLDDYAAYEKERIFGPREYWAGSSIAEPCPEDWLADGFEVVKTLRPSTGAVTR